MVVLNELFIVDSICFNLHRMRDLNVSAVQDADVIPVMEIDDLKAKPDQIIETSGAIHAIRDLNNLAFVVIRTFRGTFQAVLDGRVLEDLKNLKEGDYVNLTGKVSVNTQARAGVEVQAHSITKIGGPSEPLGMKLSGKLTMTPDNMLNERVLTLRNELERARFKLQEGVVVAFREYFSSRRFTEIHSPKLVEAGAEGGANIFSLEYFGKKAFLAQSPQFYKQFMVPVFGRVYEVGPVFRAEQHNTSRHVNEYTSLDCELGYIHSFRDVMREEVGFLRYLMQKLQQNYAQELALLKVELPVIGENIPSVPFKDIKEVVVEKYKRKFRDPHDLEPEEEKLISRYAKEQLGSDFIFVTNYPWKKRPFYTMRSSDDPEYTEGFDLLFRGIEITTGGQRIHDHAMQVQAMKDKGLDPAKFGEYLKLHRYGTPPHGGFAIGLERLTMKLLNRDNVRDTTLFPRDVDRLVP
jgi:nondiscriminating aspartyl-tRNA synthetase